MVAVMAAELRTASVFCGLCVILFNRRFGSKLGVEYFRALYQFSSDDRISRKFFRFFFLKRLCYLFAYNQQYLTQLTRDNLIF